jgi:hypothetical protein
MATTWMSKEGGILDRKMVNKNEFVQGKKLLGAQVEN